MMKLISVALANVLFAPMLWSQEHDHHAHHNMSHDDNGMVMYENRDTLPRGCEGVTEDIDLTIKAGASYARNTPGATFGMSQHEVRAPGCSRLTVTFINEDEVRHQWMVHGLPKYLYPEGMFHLEAMAGKQVTGTFIVPPDDRTYLVHCDMAQHMEKGMKGQLVVGEGSGNLWSVRGISDAFNRAAYVPERTWPVALVIIIMVSLGAARLRRQTD